MRVEGDGQEIRLPVDCYGSLNTDIRLPFGAVEGSFGCASNLAEEEDGVDAELLTDGASTPDGTA